MKTVTVRDVTLGEGIPKICVPIVEQTTEAIVHAAEKLQGLHFDVVEWRADWFDGCREIKQNEKTLMALRGVLGETPILFTFRTKAEGGERAISPEQYEQILLAAAKTGQADLVDVEVFMDGLDTEGLIQKLQESGVKVVGSNHHFTHTPTKEEIIDRLVKMQRAGADVPKIAVMPQNKADVLTLLCATEEMNRLHAAGPIITMSMSGDGVISRLCGEVFGSALTFGAAGKASAPGQVDTEELSMILELIHKAM